MSEGLRIGELRGGGLVLGYRCSSRCRHCLYGAGPHRRDGEPPDGAALDALLDLLAQRGPRARYHIGGGEPFLNLGRLEHAVAGLVKRGLTLEYVETNASWVRSSDQAEGVLQRLAERGLACVLVSLSPFHAEYVPLERTQTLVDAANRVLPGGAFVWLGEFARDLAGQPQHRAIDLAALLATRGDDYARSLAARYSLVAAGRAGRYLARHGVLVPWRELARSAPCRSRLPDTSHFHVDGEGRYVPGLCAGLVLPLEHVPGTIASNAYPLLNALVRGGPAALVEMAAPLGFVPAERYSSPCDLCSHVRSGLLAHGYDELGPTGYYDERSVGGFEV